MYLVSFLYLFCVHWCNFTFIFPSLSTTWKISLYENIKYNKRKMFARCNLSRKNAIMKIEMYSKVNCYIFYNIIKGLLFYKFDVTGFLIYNLSLEYLYLFCLKLDSWLLVDLNYLPQYCTNTSMHNELG